MSIKNLAKDLSEVTDTLSERMSQIACKLPSNIYVGSIIADTVIRLRNMVHGLTHQKYCPDYFVYKGEVYRCVGNDEGQFWTDEYDESRSTGFEQDDCEPLYLISSEIPTPSNG